MIIVILVLPLNVLGIIASNKMMKSLVEQTRLSISNIADMYIALLHDRMYKTDYFLYYIRTEDINGVEMFKQEGDSNYLHAKYRLASTINDQLDLYNGADCYYFYMPKIEDMLICAKSGDYENMQNLRRYLSNNIENIGNKFKWIVVELDNVLWLVRSLYANGVYYGAAINLSNIIKEIKKNINYNEYQVSFVTSYDKFEGKKNIDVYSNVRNADIYLNISVSRQEVVKNVSLFARSLTIVAFVFLLTIPLLFVLLHHSFIKPLDMLNYAHNQLELGNQAYRIKKKANTTEMQKAFDSFNRMADSIVNLKIENLEKEIARQKMELRNLQLQIRPHFLMNVFNLILILVKKKRTDEVMDLIIYISDYFRYINGKELELFSRELELIKKYLKVAAIMYPGRFTVNYDIDPQTLFVRIPPLLIHNFVENAIRHALKEDDITHISLISEYENGIARFRIIDDGRGMSQEEVEKITKFYLQDDKMEQQTHIGLYNSYMRIKHFYGDQASIEVTSEIGKGTNFTINIPYEVGDDYEVVDS